MQELQKASTEHMRSLLTSCSLSPSTLFCYSYWLKLQVYWQISWLHSREAGSFQMHKVCEDDISSDTKAAGLGGFLSKFDSIRKFVTKGA